MTAPLAEQWGVSPNVATFVQNLADSGSIVAAAKSSGVAQSYAYGLMRDARVQAALAVEVRKRLAIGGALGVRVLLELAEKGQSERVRADCAKALVDRAGFVAPKAAAAGSGLDQTLNEMTIDQLKDLAGKLEDELSGRARLLNAPANADTTPQASDILD